MLLGITTEITFQLVGHFFLLQVKNEQGFFALLTNQSAATFRKFQNSYSILNFSKKNYAH